MKNEMSMSVKSQNNVAKCLMLGLLGSAMIFTLISLRATSYTGILWTITFIFVTATIYVYNGHVGAEYSYSINNYGGVPTLTVGMQVGKTFRTQARLDVYNITEVKRVSYKEYKAHKCEKGIYKFSYFPTLRPSFLYLVSVRSSHENVDVFMELNEEFAKALISD